MNRSIGAALVAALLLSACTRTGGSGEGGRTNAFTRPHELTYSDAQDVNTLNPHLTSSVSTQWIAQLTMAWLIKWDERNNPYPELATEVPTQANGGVSKDGKTITYHLRRGVKWADGAAFTADDVVWTTNAVNNSANDEVGREGWDQIVKIDEPDKYTVILHMKAPYSPFVETFFSTAGANPCVLPKHLLAQYPNFNSVPYNAKPVGIGPFKVDRWDRGQQVVLVPNPLYWRGLPKLKKITYKIVPDRNTLFSQMQAKQLDMWAYASPSYASRASLLDGYNLLRANSYWYDHLDMNVAHPPLDDPVVRQALRLGFDRQERIDKIEHGMYAMTDTDTPQGPYYVPETTVAVDPKKANAMLDRAGWTAGADGIRVKNGHRLSLRFAAATGAQDVDNALELLRENWKRIGVEIDVKHYPPALFFASPNEGGIVYGDKWDLIEFAGENEAIGDFSPAYSCAGFPPAGQNDLRWCDRRAQAAMDDLYARFDQSERNADVKIVTDAIYRDVPTIMLDRRTDFYFVNKDLKNFHPNSLSQFDNMMDVDI